MRESKTDKDASSGVGKKCRASEVGMQGRTPYTVVKMGSRAIATPTASGVESLPNCISRTHVARSQSATHKQEFKYTSALLKGQRLVTGVSKETGNTRVPTPIVSQPLHTLDSVDYMQALKTKRWLGPLTNVLQTGSLDVSRCYSSLFVCTSPPRQ